jgi:3-oxoadipate enol-lactonase
VLIPAGDRRIYCDLLGPADAPVVCMAHAMSSDSTIWAEQVPALLADGWRVLRVDMRGHGGSDPVPGGYTMEELAGDVVAVLDVLGFARVHYIGLSIGGMVGQVLALDHRERLLSAMLCATSPAAVPGGMAMWRKRFEAIAAAGSVEPIADDTMRRWFTDDFDRLERVAQIRSTVANCTPAGYCGGAAAIIGYDVTDRLPGVTTPTLVVCGDDDPGTPAEGNRLIARRIPGARYEEIAHARHLLNVQHPEQFNRIMLEWLAGHR